MGITLHRGFESRPLRFAPTSPGRAGRDVTARLHRPHALPEPPPRRRPPAPPRLSARLGLRVRTRPTRVRAPLGPLTRRLRVLGADSNVLPAHARRGVDLRLGVLLADSARARAGRRRDGSAAP